MSTKMPRSAEIRESLLSKSVSDHMRATLREQLAREAVGLASVNMVREVNGFAPIPAGWCQQCARCLDGVMTFVCGVARQNLCGACYAVHTCTNEACQAHRRWLQSFEVVGVRTGFVGTMTAAE